MGRCPSLPRFIDELRELREAESNDAPDEGVIETQGVDAGRVRILTIHGAKGLEAPIVWLLGANASPRAQDAWDILLDWPPEASSPRHFSFYGRKEERGAARQPIFDAETLAAKREELNLLYVAITRARQVFLASGIENARVRDDTPYRRLETALKHLGGEQALAYGDGVVNVKWRGVRQAGFGFDDRESVATGGWRASRPAECCRTLRHSSSRFA